MVEKKITKTELKIDLETIKKKRDFTFYSNIAGITRTETDVYIDFLQFPPDENVAPSVRIYMSPLQAKKLMETLQNVFEASIEGIAEKKK